jgi:RNA polymerase sigma factor (sigma-70 family)
MSSEDAQIVEAFLRGEASAVALLDRWIAQAAGAFHRRLSSEWDDVLQEARLEMLRLLQKGQYRGEARLRTYLWQVVGHLCIGFLRRQRRRSRVEDAPEAAAEEPASDDPSPFDRVLLHERDERLLGALQAMSRECRQVWRLILEGLSYREIGERLGATEGALRVRAHRCGKAAAEALIRNVSTGSGP